LLLVFGAVYFAAVRGGLALVSKRLEEDPKLKAEADGDTDVRRPRWRVGERGPPTHPLRSSSVESLDDEVAVDDLAEQCDVTVRPPDPTRVLDLNEFILGHLDHPVKVEALDRQQGTTTLRRERLGQNAAQPKPGPVIEQEAPDRHDPRGIRRQRLVDRETTLYYRTIHDHSAIGTDIGIGIGIDTSIDTRALRIVDHRSVIAIDDAFDARTGDRRSIVTRIRRIDLFVR
jgi:hypothetical protein